MEIGTVQKLETEIRELKDRLIKTLQDYSRNQVDLWRQVPALAREADGLKGRTCGRYQMAYLSGYWPISKSDIHWLWVDLQTGELGGVQLFSGFDEIELGMIDSIIRDINASEVINLLNNEILNNGIKSLPII